MLYGNTISCISLLFNNRAKACRTITGCIFYHRHYWWQLAAPAVCGAARKVCLTLRAYLVFFSISRHRSANLRNRRAGWFENMIITFTI